MSLRRESKVGGRSGRPCEAEVGGHGSSIWEAVRVQGGRQCEAEVGGRSGRLRWEAEVGGRGSPRWEAV